MNIIDKIADWLDVFGKFKKRVNDWCQFKDTQIALAVVMFFIMLVTVFYSMYKTGLQWYWYLILLSAFALGVLLLIVQVTRKERKTAEKSPLLEVATIGLDFNKTILDNIYYVLRGFEKIDVEKTKIDNFYSVLTQRFEDTDSEIHFIGMNWVELRYLLEKFKEKCGVEYSTFEKSQKLFLEGKPVTAKKLSNNGLRKNPEKHFVDKIDNCFPR